MAEFETLADISTRVENLPEYQEKYRAHYVPFNIKVDGSAEDGFDHTTIHTDTSAIFSTRGGLHTKRPAPSILNVRNSPPAGDFTNAVQVIAARFCKDFPLDTKAVLDLSWQRLSYYFDDMDIHHWGAGFLQEVLMCIFVNNRKQQSEVLHFAVHIMATDPVRAKHNAYFGRPEWTPAEYLCYGNSFLTEVVKFLKHRDDMVRQLEKLSPEYHREARGGLMYPAMWCTEHFKNLRNGHVAKVAKHMDSVLDLGLIDPGLALSFLQPTVAASIDSGSIPAADLDDREILGPTDQIVESEVEQTNHERRTSEHVLDSSPSRGLYRSASCYDSVLVIQKPDFKSSVVGSNVAGDLSLHITPLSPGRNSRVTSESSEFRKVYGNSNDTQGQESYIMATPATGENDVQRESLKNDHKPSSEVEKIVMQVANYRTSMAPVLSIPQPRQKRKAIKSTIDPLQLDRSVQAPEKNEDLAISAKAGNSTPFDATKQAENAIDHGADYQSQQTDSKAEANVIGSKNIPHTSPSQSVAAIVQDGDIQSQQTARNAQMYANDNQHGQIASHSQTVSQDLPPFQASHGRGPRKNGRMNGKKNGNFDKRDPSGHWHKNGKKTQQQSSYGIQRGGDSSDVTHVDKEKVDSKRSKRPHERPQGGDMSKTNGENEKTSRPSSALTILEEDDSIISIVFNGQKRTSPYHSPGLSETSHRVQPATSVAHHVQQWNNSQHSSPPSDENRGTNLLRPLPGWNGPVTVVAGPPPPPSMQMGPQIMTPHGPLIPVTGPPPMHLSGAPGLPMPLDLPPFMYQPQQQFNPAISPFQPNGYGESQQADYQHSYSRGFRKQYPSDVQHGQGRAPFHRNVRSQQSHRLNSHEYRSSLDFGNTARTTSTGSYVAPDQQWPHIMPNHRPSFQRFSSQDARTHFGDQGLITAGSQAAIVPEQSSRLERVALPLHEQREVVGPVQVHQSLYNYPMVYSTSRGSLQPDQDAPKPVGVIEQAPTIPKETIDTVASFEPATVESAVAPVVQLPISREQSPSTKSVAASVEAVFSEQRPCSEQDSAPNGLSTVDENQGTIDTTVQLHSKTDHEMSDMKPAPENDKSSATTTTVVADESKKSATPSTASTLSQQPFTWAQKAKAQSAAAVDSLAVGSNSVTQSDAFSYRAAEPSSASNIQASALTRNDTLCSSTSSSSSKKSFSSRRGNLDGDHIAEEKLYVAGVGLTNEKLENIFEPFKPTSIAALRDCRVDFRKPAQPDGMKYTFVTFTSKEACDKARMALYGQTKEDVYLKVNVAFEKEDRPLTQSASIPLRWRPLDAASCGGAANGQKPAITPKNPMQDKAAFWQHINRDKQMHRPAKSTIVVPSKAAEESFPAITEAPKTRHARNSSSTQSDGKSGSGEVTKLQSQGKGDKVKRKSSSQSITPKKVDASTKDEVAKSEVAEKASRPAHATKRQPNGLAKSTPQDTRKADSRQGNPVAQSFSLSQGKSTAAVPLNVSAHAATASQPPIQARPMGETSKPTTIAPLSVPVQAVEVEHPPVKTRAKKSKNKQHTKSKSSPGTSSALNGITELSETTKSTALAALQPGESLSQSTTAIPSPEVTAVPNSPIQGRPEFPPSSPGKIARAVRQFGNLFRGKSQEDRVDKAARMQPSVENEEDVAKTELNNGLNTTASNGQKEHAISNGSVRKKRNNGRKKGKMSVDVTDGTLSKALAGGNTSQLHVENNGPPQSQIGHLLNKVEKNIEKEYLTETRVDKHHAEDPGYGGLMQQGNSVGQQVGNYRELHHPPARIFSADPATEASRISTPHFEAEGTSLEQSGISEIADEESRSNTKNETGPAKDLPAKSTYNRRRNFKNRNKSGGGSSNRAVPNGKDDDDTKSGKIKVDAA